MSSTFGKLFRVTTFGESHGPGIGAVIDGVLPGTPVDPEVINAALARRRPGQSAMTTARRESDTCQILSGVFEGYATGTPVALFIPNTDQRSHDYDPLRDLCRPGHADWAYMLKYGRRDHRGGGRSSGRETAARVAAGAVAGIMLARRGVKITAWTEQIGPIRAETPDFAAIEKNPVRCPDPAAAAKMVEYIRETAAGGDSVGGIVAFEISGVPAGWGEPVFDRTGALLAHAMFSIGAVRGFELGRGFAAAGITGSENNASPDGSGCAGGITLGEPIRGRIAVKPTPSISRPQIMRKLDGSEVEASVSGRHDPCICPRIVPVVEAMAALVMADLMLMADASGQDRKP